MNPATDAAGARLRVPATSVVMKRLRVLVLAALVITTANQVIRDEAPPRAGQPRSAVAAEAPGSDAVQWVTPGERGGCVPSDARVLKLRLRGAENGLGVLPGDQVDVLRPTPLADATRTCPDGRRCRPVFEQLRVWAVGREAVTLDGQLTDVPVVELLVAPQMIDPLVSAGAGGDLQVVAHTGELDLAGAWTSNAR